MIFCAGKDYLLPKFIYKELKAKSLALGFFKKLFSTFQILKIISGRFSFKLVIINGYIRHREKKKYISIGPECDCDKESTLLCGQPQWNICGKKVYIINDPYTGIKCDLDFILLPNVNSGTCNGKSYKNLLCLYFS